MNVRVVFRPDIFRSLCKIPKIAYRKNTSNPGDFRNFIEAKDDSGVLFKSKLFFFFLSNTCVGSNQSCGVFGGGGILKIVR